ncbi:Naphthalene 1,2-dioxygenase/salicylate 5-hydroxylase systems, ferredoxin component [Pigmentiphaga humi]|uniref:Naphthalene 1,2-dioxygenase/salicylate 5-hydroxylase systems, ferredoxin component n=1 Tax=Pigmentiphaga humi TaxID=2478468 RepID=A0A3P4B5J6_9BURK|nr:non-heme iron oxygenase ferredoxin subunit [Pigmentiphaga humi]VCU70928.1 Naphthalene 1,2-dioxygenase/salicylate 5-hydroxylase systems, ferredoxin component [Pigmentiphaga humi]
MTDRWVDIAARSELPDDDVVAVRAEGVEIALYDVGGEVFATDNICTHGNARLCDGFLEEGEIECPLHQGRFDVRTGKALCAPLTQDVRTFPAKVDGERIWVLFRDA